MKYQIGETFGRTTSQLLNDSRIASSKHPVLSALQHEPSLDKRQQLISQRGARLGDQKLVDNMVPGYTGKIKLNTG